MMGRKSGTIRGGVYSRRKLVTWEVATYAAEKEFGAASESERIRECLGNPIQDTEAAVIRAPQDLRNFSRR